MDMQATVGLLLLSHCRPHIPEVPPPSQGNVLPCGPPPSAQNMPASRAPVLHAARGAGAPHQGWDSRGANKPPPQGATLQLVLPPAALGVKTFSVSLCRPLAYVAVIPGLSMQPVL